MLLARLNGQKIKVALVATSWLHAAMREISVLGVGNAF